MKIPGRVPVDQEERMQPGSGNLTRLCVRPKLKHPNEQYGRLVAALDSPKGIGNVFDADYSSGVSTRVQSQDVFYRGPAEAPIPTLNVVRARPSASRNREAPPEWRNCIRFSVRLMRDGASPGERPASMFATRSCSCYQDYLYSSGQASQTGLIG